MKIQLIAALLIALPVLAAERQSSAVWTDEATAAREVDHFALIGEYVSIENSRAVQANLLSDGTFLVAVYKGGLPGKGWDQSKIDSRVLSPGELEALLAGYTKVERESPTLGKPSMTVEPWRSTRFSSYIRISSISAMCVATASVYLRFDP